MPGKRNSQYPHNRKASTSGHSQVSTTDEEAYLAFPPVRAQRSSRSTASSTDSIASQQIANREKAKSDASSASFLYQQELALARNTTRDSPSLSYHSMDSTETCFASADELGNDPGIFSHMLPFFITKLHLQQPIDPEGNNIPARDIFKNEQLSVHHTTPLQTIINVETNHLDSIKDLLEFFRRNKFFKYAIQEQKRPPEHKTTDERTPLNEQTPTNQPTPAKLRIELSPLFINLNFALFGRGNPYYTKREETTYYLDTAKSVVTYPGEGKITFRPVYSCALPIDGKRQEFIYEPSIEPLTITETTSALNIVNYYRVNIQNLRPLDKITVSKTRYKSIHAQRVRRQDREGRLYNQRSRTDSDLSVIESKKNCCIIL